MLKLIPNILTTSRLILALPICLLILQQRFDWVLGLVLVAGLSDGVDGFLARALNAKTRYGAVVDPIADKTLITSTYICLALVNIIPDWLAIIVVSRDLIILTGGLLYHRFIGPYKMAPTLWGKLSTMFQIVFALAVITHQVFPIIPSDIIQALAWLVLALAFISGGNYVSIWSNKALQAKQQSR